MARLKRITSTFGAAGAALTSMAASICCAGTVGVALLGVNGAILGALLKAYRLYLLAAGLILLAYAHWNIR